ncbi:MAG: dihydrodipicolinate synthase family protein [Candidatus Hydrogenedentes bacterium]|nr:dihydrodipicolinate synthase family protein [Candidatus Hydrogenedentota bacterium]
MNVPDHIRGSIAPTFTAFNEDGTLDDQGQRNLIDFMEQQGGVSAYFIRAGMGQLYAFTVDDVKQLAANVCGHLKGQTPVLVGCNGDWNRDYTKLPDPERFIEQGVELCKFAQDAGAAGVVHTVPEAIALNGESREDLFLRYFETMCAAIDIPLYIYQPPASKPEYHLTADLLVKLADIDNLCGAKVSTPDAEIIFNLAHATRDKEFSYIVGCETAAYAGLYAGATAIIGQGTSVNPRVINAIQDAHEKGDQAAALAAQEDTNALVYACGNPVDFFKRYATEKGFTVKPHFRTMNPNPYGQDPAPLTDDAYASYKTLLESMLEKY